jgi:hypothetical protein
MKNNNTMKFAKLLMCLMIISGTFLSVSLAQVLPAGKTPPPTAPPAPVLLSTQRLAIAGLAHDHVHNILSEYRDGKVIIVGIAEADKQAKGTVSS